MAVRRNPRSTDGLALAPILGAVLVDRFTPDLSRGHREREILEWLSDLPKRLCEAG